MIMIVLEISFRQSKLTLYYLCCFVSLLETDAFEGLSEILNVSAKRLKIVKL